MQERAGGCASRGFPARHRSAIVSNNGSHIALPRIPFPFPHSPLVYSPTLYYARIHSMFPIKGLVHFASAVRCDFAPWMLSVHVLARSRTSFDRNAHYSIGAITHISRRMKIHYI